MQPKDERTTAHRGQGQRFSPAAIAAIRLQNEVMLCKEGVELATYLLGQGVLCFCAGTSVESHNDDHLPWYPVVYLIGCDHQICGTQRHDPPLLVWLEVY